MNKKEDFCVSFNYTMKEVMDVLQRIRERGVIVLDNENKVSGVLSQGDIINALANGSSLYSPIEKIYNTDFIYLNKKDLKKAFEIFKKKNLCLIPIIDENYRLEDVLTARNLLAYADFSKES